MKTDELRERYLTFFEQKGCVRRPSDVLIPRDDPTVLFTPAGMNQFKDQFLGRGKLEFTRAVTCQKCLRTGDTQNVGVTAYHHTFFEMLGNFSFGDYFKREAINWAWEFLTDKKWLGLKPDTLSVSVYEEDDEAYDIWLKEIKIPAGRIRRDNEDENFWPAGAPSNGPDGVCGPCSEIFFHPGNGNKEVEIWNLVFTQFNRVGDPPDNLRPLPKKNIDTGMGLERAASVMQGVLSNFEIDILRPLCLAAGEAIDMPYEFNKPYGRAVRRIADHVRAVTFAVHEGAEPGSEKESYVVRQLLRRAVLEGYLLGKHDPFLFSLVPTVCEIMRVPYPELTQTADSVANVIREEEEQFLGIVERGLARFKECVAKAQKQNKSVISGDDAFDLHQTDGFLVELTEAMAARMNLAVDMHRFTLLMDRHRKGSGAGAFLDAVMKEGPIDALRKTAGATEFLGYETTESDGTVIGIIAEKQLVDKLTEIGHDSFVAVVLDRTPFYAEAGGQIGDTGFLVGEGCKFHVLDTQRDGTLILHIGHLQDGRLEVGQRLTARVDAPRRAAIRRAHSATHLLHHALRAIVGEKATQRGSKVQEDQFRFDFAHRGPLTPEELTKVEDELNGRIAQGAAVATRIMDLNNAKKLGAMALFGEKYADEVRVVSMGDFSIELCGGTHLSNTGQVGCCKIVSEEPVAKGVRRITALTGPKAWERIRWTERILDQLRLQLKAPQVDDLPKRIAALQEELRTVKQQLAQQTSSSVEDAVEELLANAEDVAGVRIIVEAPKNATREMLREHIDQLRARKIPVAILLGVVEEGKVALIAAVTKDLIERGLNASECVRAAAKLVGGGGGGRPDMAEAGGKNPDNLPEALKAGAAFYKSKLRG